MNYYNEIVEINSFVVDCVIAFESPGRKAISDLVLG